MEFWTKYGTNIAYCMAILISLTTIIIGIVAKIKDKKPSKNKIFAAKVLGCLTSENFIPGMWRTQGFDIILEIYTPKGIIKREIKRMDPLDIGTTVEVYFDSKKDVIRFTDEAFNEEKKYPIVLIAFGIFFLLVTLLFLTKAFVRGGEVLIGLFACLAFSSVFIFVGLWLSFIRPHQLNKNMIHCERIEGRIADVVRQGTIGSHEFGDCDDIAYAYIYEYEYGGVKRTIKSKTSSAAHTHAEIGRKVEIIINHKTGDVFCMDDEKSGAGIGIVALIIGTLAIPGVIYFISVIIRG